MPFKQAGTALEFTLPAKPVDPYDSVLVLDIADREPKVAARYRADALPDRLDLYAWVARLRGEEIRYDWPTQSATGFKHFEQESNGLLWYPYKSLDGEYEVELTYACADAAAGSKFRLASDQRGSAASSIEGVIEATHGEFVTKKLNGKLAIQPNTGTISFALPGEDKSAPMKLRKITLIRAAP